MRFGQRRLMRFLVLCSGIILTPQGKSMNLLPTRFRVPTSVAVFLNIKPISTVLISFDVLVRLCVREDIYRCKWLLPSSRFRSCLPFVKFTYTMGVALFSTVVTMRPGQVLYVASNKFPNAPEPGFSMFGQRLRSKESSA